MRLPQAGRRLVWHELFFMVNGIHFKVFLLETFE